MSLTVKSIQGYFDDFFVGEFLEISNKYLFNTTPFYLVRRLYQFGVPVKKVDRHGIAPTVVLDVRRVGRVSGPRNTGGCGNGDDALYLFV